MTENARRPLKHRARERNFRFSDYSKPQSKAPKDDRTLNRKGPQVEIVRPKWNGAAPMTFRPLPMFCAENPELFDPTRLTTDEYDFSDFMRSIPAVKYVGIDQKFTFLTYDPRRVYDSNYNPRTDNPYHVLYNAVMDAVKKTGEAIVNGRDVMTGKWSPLVNDGPSKAFNAPSKLYFLQGVIFESDGELYIKGGSAPKGLRDGDLPQIIELTKSAGDKIARKLNMISNTYNGDNEVEYQAEMYAYGDVVDLANGMYFTLFNPDKHNNVVDLHEDFDEDANDSDGGYVSWGVGINPTFEYMVKRAPVSLGPDISQYAAQISNSLVSWDDILYFPPDEEICLWMAQAFRSQPGLLEFGWQDNPAFFTDEVQGILANRTQVQGASGGEDETPDIVPKNRGGAAKTQTQASQRTTADAPTPKPTRSAGLPKRAPDPIPEVQEEDNSDYEEADLALEAGDEVVGEVGEELEDDAEFFHDSESVEEFGTLEAELEAEVTEDDELAALEAVERAKLRATPTKTVGPASPPPRKPGFTEKPPVATTPVKARVVSKPTPVRKK